MMDKDEKKFIYGQLKYLTETVNTLLLGVARQQDMIEGLIKVIDKMQSPDYAKRQSDVARAVDIAEKIKFVRSLKDN